MTHLPGAISPAIDGGNDSVLPVDLFTDQRGPGFPRIWGDTVGLGSAEARFELPDYLFGDSFETKVTR